MTCGREFVTEYNRFLHGVIAPIYGVMLNIDCMIGDRTESTSRRDGGGGGEYSPRMKLERRIAGCQIGIYLS